MIVGWWQQEVANALHQFYVDLIEQRRPKLVIMSPPQHGKSTQVVDFLMWIAGLSPDLKAIYASYSGELGEVANLSMQRTFDSDVYQKVFGQRLSSRGDGDWQRNRSVLEYVGRRGSFRCTTVAGQITGQGLDIGVIDDPVKGRAEVMQKGNRDKIWAWFTDDFFSRFSDRAGMIWIGTRWHIDDPVGRLMEHVKDVKILRYPAIDCDDPRRDATGALFPQFKSIEFLLERKKVQTQAGWESEYQQNPIIVGGGMFPIDKVDLLPERPVGGQVRQAIRYWDKAGTHDGGAYSAGVLMVRLVDGTFCVVDVRRGQWSAFERERMILQTAELDQQMYETTRTIVEQEPGSGGKESAESTIRMLSGFSVEADRVTGAKEVRADPFAAQWQAGNVKLVAGAWTRDYLDEHEQFPTSKFKDQVDASSGAFNKLANKYRYPDTLDWVS